MSYRLLEQAVRVECNLGFRIRLHLYTYPLECGFRVQCLGAGQRVPFFSLFGRVLGLGSRVAAILKFAMCAHKGRLL